MTDTTVAEQKLRAIVEDEVVQGFKIKQLPADITASIAEEGLRAIPAIRFTRLNPRRRRTAASLVMRQYQSDLQDPEILSNEQVLKLVTERGEWGAEREARIKALQTSSNKLMSDLYSEGFAEDADSWGSDILENAAEFRTSVNATDLSDDDKADTHARFNRWVEYTAQRQAEYTAKYAAAQGREDYSPDRDMQVLMDRMGSRDLAHIDQLNMLEELLDKMHRFLQLNEERLELQTLQQTRTRIFTDTVESRRDNTEEMARLYVTCEVCDTAGKSTGPLSADFDNLWDLPDDAIQWLLVESYFYHQGIPDEARPYLETFGFLREGRKENGESAPSEPSPEPQSSSSDSAPVEKTEPGSLV